MLLFWKAESHDTTVTPVSLAGNVLKVRSKKPQSNTIVPFLRSRQSNRGLLAVTGVYFGAEGFRCFYIGGILRVRSD